MEHDLKWICRLEHLLPTNAHVYRKAASSEAGTSEGEGGEYAQAITAYPAAHFDVIVIDGMERINCARNAPARLKGGGIILFDNSDRPPYRPGLEALKHHGFSRVDFFGPIPGYGHQGCTSVFFRDGNGAISVDGPPRYLGY